MLALAVSSCRPSTVCLQHSVDLSLHHQNKILSVCCSWQMEWLCCHTARPASPPFGLFQSICAEPATGSGFGRAALQAAGHVLQQTGAPLGKHAGDRTGSTFLCCGAKRASVCVTACPMYVCEHGQKLRAQMHQRVAAGVPSTLGHCEKGSTQQGKPQHLAVMFWYVVVCVNWSRWYGLCDVVEKLLVDSVLGFNPIKVLLWLILNFKMFQRQIFGFLFNYSYATACNISSEKNVEGDFFIAPCFSSTSDSLVTLSSTNSRQDFNLQWSICSVWSGIRDKKGCEALFHHSVEVREHWKSAYVMGNKTCSPSICY